MQQTLGKHYFDFWPKSFVLPKEIESLAQEMERDPHRYWIVKPAGAS